MINIKKYTLVNASKLSANILSKKSFITKIIDKKKKFYFDCIEHCMKMGLIMGFMVSFVLQMQNYSLLQLMTFGLFWSTILAINCSNIFKLYLFNLVYFI